MRRTHRSGRNNPPGLDACCPSGFELGPLTGPDADDITVEGEINKLASNIALGRNFAGVHWRSDYTESIRLGECVAISMLGDHACLYNEDFTFRFRTFDGDPVTIARRPNCVWPRRPAG